jgi:hypothetical protein
VRGIVTHKLPDPSWGFPQVARVIPNDDHPWGALRFLVGTEWEPLFPRVHRDVLDQALRGHATPLMRVLGSPPKALVKRLPKADTLCAQRDRCINHKPLCVPGPKVPECWETSTFPPEVASLVNYIIKLWKEGVVVIVALPEVSESVS